MIIKRQRHRLNCYRSAYGAGKQQQQFLGSTDRLSRHLDDALEQQLTPEELTALFAAIARQRHTQALQSIHDAEAAIRVVNAWHSDMTTDERLSARDRLADAIYQGSL